MKSVCFITFGSFTLLICALLALSNISSSESIRLKRGGPFDGYYGGGGGGQYNYGYSGWRGGGLGGYRGRPFEKFHRPRGYGGYSCPNCHGLGWRGDSYPYSGPGIGLGGGPGLYAPYSGSASEAHASASASSSGLGQGGPFGGLGHSDSHAHSETASFNLGPIKATFSKSDAHANSGAIGK